ncbi:hippurate hydrolase [Paraburkholderia eburnea]|uniref:Hippurate hydrolase n=1 Tax=Paraburkholderia eburnea TaxID=1189126 RepID=A0A2S4LWS7_9BURK|nr:M20 aminoacylase family protein [Paraburkholderia eburnea]POR46900.1 hippurate hydrolase [Paraburkholderia eburnea]PRZ18003.1 hippurate hydrolase [Paraburkholderia eburnea]
MEFDTVPRGMREIQDEMIAIRRRIHAMPELGFEEIQTGNLVASCLEKWGYRVHRGLGRTGVVGTLKNGEGPSLALRADMDALPIQEESALPYASAIAGKMHACGHDGHTAILLAAARYLAEHRQFKGTLHLVFQPAEEGLGGAKAMLDDGLFELFPCDAIFALHNMPGLPAGKFGFVSGPCLASSDTVTIRVYGHGGHGAMPHVAVDPVVVCASLVMALQSIVSRNVNPLDSAIVTVGEIRSGDAPNVIPDMAQMRLSVRAFNPEVRSLLERRITDLTESHAKSFGARAEVDYQRRYPVLVNHEAQTALAREVALNWLGEDGLVPNMRPVTASEDFAFLLEKKPGCYLFIGNGDGEGGCMVHNPRYDFNDACLPVAATYWVKLVERFLG